MWPRPGPESSRGILEALSSRELPPIPTTRGFKEARLDAPVIAGLISGIAIVASPVVAFFLTKAYEERDLQPMGRGRRKALTGHWRGTTTQPGMSARIEVHLDAARKKVRGTAELRFDAGEAHVILLRLEGGFLHDRFLKLDYAKKEKDGALQFGTLLVELSEDARWLRGTYSGYGSMTRSIVSGTIEVEKVG